MSEKDKFSAYFLGLIPRLQAEVGLRLEGDTQRSLRRATEVAQRAEEYLKIKYPNVEDRRKNEAGFQKKNNPQKPQGRGNVNALENAGESSQVNAVGNPNRGGRGGRRGGRRGGQRGRGRGRMTTRGPPKCFCCGGEHLLRDCEEWTNIRNQSRSTAQQ